MLSEGSLSPSERWCCCQDPGAVCLLRHCTAMERLDLSGCFDPRHHQPTTAATNTDTDDDDEDDDEDEEEDDEMIATERYPPNGRAPLLFLLVLT